MRLTENDRRCGPLTWGRASWNPLRLVFSTGGGDDEYPRNHLTAYAFGYVARLDLPTSVKPWRRWVDTSVYNWSKSPDGGYWDVHPREFGFSLCDGFLQIFHGPQTNDSTTTKSTSWHLPWTQWRHVRRSFYGLDGERLFDEDQALRGDARFKQWNEQRESVPKRTFEIDDFDGNRVTVTTFIEEREWRFGTGWFKWLSLFRRPRILRSLDIHFGAGVGPDKGSWKGGLVGHSIDMLPGELHESAMRRYCEQEHKSRSGQYRLRFVGQIEVTERD